jgi:glucosamine-6-phosphate deaminase
MNLLKTLNVNPFKSYYPEGWDWERIDSCCANMPETVLDRQPFWNEGFTPVQCESLSDFDTYMGYEIAKEIKLARDEGKHLALIMPVGPMGMYRWAVFFLRDWGVKCDHVYGFNMDEWSDENGNTLPASDPAAFENAMIGAFYGPLGDLSVPQSHRYFATKDVLPVYADRIADLRAKGARLITVYGIGRAFHIAFWEPHFAMEYASDDEWKKATHRVGAMLHPLTIEQNALTSFRSRTGLVSACANTVGPGLFLQSDRCIGGCDGALSRGIQWQGQSLWVTLRYGPTRWITSSFIPTLPGKLFFLKELAGPLMPDTN